MCVCARRIMCAGNPSGMQDALEDPVLIYLCVYVYMYSSVQSIHVRTRMYVFMCRAECSEGPGICASICVCIEVCICACDA